MPDRHRGRTRRPAAGLALQGRNDLTTSIHSRALVALAVAAQCSIVMPLRLANARSSHGQPKGLVGGGSPAPCDGFGSTRDFDAIGAEVMRINRDSGSRWGIFGAGEGMGRNWLLTPAESGPGDAHITPVRDTRWRGSVHWPTTMGWRMAPRHLHLLTMSERVWFAITATSDGRDGIDLHCMQDAPPTWTKPIASVGMRFGVDDFASSLPTKTARSLGLSMYHLMAKTRVSVVLPSDSQSSEIVRTRFEIDGQTVEMRPGQCWFFRQDAYRGALVLHGVFARSHHIYNWFEPNFSIFLY